MRVAHNFIDLTGSVFGDLTVIGPYEARRGVTYWNCQCSCGVTKYIARASLSSGKSVSCGCKRGLSPNRYVIKHREGVTALKNMKTRCHNYANRDFKYYGDRGIGICVEWLKDSYSFYKWYDDNYVEGLSIDRIDNDADYSPTNCKFSTASEQCSNRGPWDKKGNV